MTSIFRNIKSEAIEIRQIRFELNAKEKIKLCVKLWVFGLAQHTKSFKARNDGKTFHFQFQAIFVEYFYYQQQQALMPRNANRLQIFFPTFLFPPATLK